ncbi:MAG: T9SS type A sorting domain-containing protein [Bacteroidota bacterium]
MKKFTIVLILCLFTGLNSFGQQWEWAKSYGTNNGDQASTLALDPSGNSFISGYYQGTQLILGATTLNTTFSNNLFVAKHNSAGTVVWAQSIGSNGSLIIGSVCTGTNGNIYVCGTFSGPTLMFGTTTVSLTANTISNLFIGCFSSSGSALWVNKYGTSPSPYGVSAKSCYYSPSDNSVCMTGTFTGTLTIGSTTLINSTTSNDIFLTKLSVAPFSASPTWAIKAGSSSSSDVSERVRIDKQSNIYVAGSFQPVTGSTTTIGATLTTKGGQDLFIAKYNSSGAWQWSQSFGSTSGVDFLYDMALDTAGSVFVTGSYNSNLLFNTFFGTSTLTAVGGSDVYVAKWASIGLYSSSVKIGSSAGNEAGYGLGSDDKGNIYLGATYSGSSLAIGSTTLTNSGGGINGFVTKISSSLAFKWSRSSMGAGSVSMKGLEADANDNVYSCGTIQVSAPSSFGTTTLTSVGGSDFFVSKISCVTPTITAANASYTVCENSSNSFTAAISTPQSDVTYKWSATGATGVVISPTTGTATTISYTGTTSFSIVVTGTNACSSVTTTVGSVVVNPLPSVTAASSPTTICNGSSAVLYGGGASTYIWSPTVPNGVATQHFMGEPTYTVAGTDANGCENTATLALNIVASPTIAVTGNSLVCLNSPNILSANGAATYTWSPGSTVSPTINAQPSSNTVYTVNSQDANGCIGSATFSLNLVSPQTPDICEVTVDSLSQYNNVIWDKTLYNNVDSFIVYREVSTGTYRRIGAQHQSAYSLFVDTARSIGPANGDPNITSYRYKLQIRDTCGNYSEMSPYHNTIYFLTNSSGSFFWNMYNIEFQPSTPILTFELIRDNLGTNAWVSAGSCAGNQSSLTDPLFSSFPNANYRVIGNGFSCNATSKTAQQINKSKSNVKNNFNIFTGISLLSKGDVFSISPNPASTELVVSFITEVKEMTLIAVTNVLGKVVLSNEVYEGKKISLSLNDLTDGVYFIRVQRGNNFTDKKFIKN